MKNLHFKVSENIGEVSAIFSSPKNPKAIFVFAHGAGAGMNHKFMEEVSSNLVSFDIAVFRYQFPYMEKGKRSPDYPNVLLKTVQAAVEKAESIYKELPIFAGGKSLGGRMTSTAASKNLIPQIKGIIFFGFPLHAPGKPSSDRAEHLYEVKVPMLFLQGTRDKLADLNLLKPVIKKIGRKASLKIIEGADHSFHVLKSFKKSDSEIIEELSKLASSWMLAKVNKFKKIN